MDRMKHEVSGIPLNGYVKVSILASVALLCFLYFASFVANVTGEIEFQRYDNILLLATIIYMMGFSMLAAVMYGKYGVQEYRSKQIEVLTSNPIEHKKMALSKLAVVASFITLSMIVGYLPPILIYGLTELLFPIINDGMSLQFIILSLKLLGIIVIVANGIGVIVMRIGLIRKSVPITLVTSFVLCGIMGNAVVGNFNNNMYLIGLCIFTVFITVIMVYSLRRAV